MSHSYRYHDYNPEKRRGRDVSFMKASVPIGASGRYNDGVEPVSASCSCKNKVCHCKPRLCVDENGQVYKGEMSSY